MVYLLLITIKSVSFNFCILRQTDRAKGIEEYILSKHGVQSTGYVVFMVIDGLFPQSDLYIRVTLKKTANHILD